MRHGYEVASVRPMHVVDRAADLLPRPLDLRAQLLDPFPRVVELRLETGQALRERLEALIESGERPGLVNGLGDRLARAVRVAREGLPNRGGSPGDRLAMLGGGQA